MKFRTFLLITAIATTGAVGGGMAGVRLMNWQLERGDRVHISMVWGSAAAGAAAGLMGYGALCLHLSRRHSRQLDQLEADTHRLIEEHQLPPEQQAPLILALKRMRERLGGGEGN